jgi:hypothetical protein
MAGRRRRFRDHSLVLRTIEAVDRAFIPHADRDRFHIDTVPESGGG